MLSPGRSAFRGKHSRPDVAGGRAEAPAHARNRRGAAGDRRPRGPAGDRGRRLGGARSRARRAGSCGGPGRGPRGADRTRLGPDHRGGSGRMGAAAAVRWGHDRRLRGGASRALGTARLRAPARAAGRERRRPSAAARAGPGAMPDRPGRLGPRRGPFPGRAPAGHGLADVRLPRRAHRRAYLRERPGL